MFRHDQYELIDFGAGRRLESWGGYRLDRPCPIASNARQSHPDEWSSAHGRYLRSSADQGCWSTAGELPERWEIVHNEVRFELRLTPFGHLGVFPEQSENWDWLAATVRGWRNPPKLLNLFAYTGGATLAAAAAGAQVVHVDAARNVVAWARRNATLSGLENAPIRWIVEDAGKFVQRELRRGNRYDGVILDPPSYGHGPKGERWQLDRDLPALLSGCAALTAGDCRLWLLTCHTPGMDGGRLEDLLRHVATTGGSGKSSLGGHAAGELHLATRSGRRLPSGCFARWAECCR